MLASPCYPCRGRAASCIASTPEAPPSPLLPLLLDVHMPRSPFFDLGAGAASWRCILDGGGGDSVWRDAGRTGNAYWEVRKREGGGQDSAVKVNKEKRQQRIISVY
ncbi:hypothetical protein E2C01_017449 [Portunus trituberculatus]|uniref:Uncharacterized protein n=1 Tax=Portunus trituberculatus TaxID=210409 RepID=A0A5B7DSH8_PORTR|nr:hypothetical protein [Portunus trituberculatus]